MTSDDIIRSDVGAPAIRRATGRRLGVFLPAIIFAGMAVLLGWGLTRNASDIASALIGKPVFITVDPDRKFADVVEGTRPGEQIADKISKLIADRPT